MDKIYVVGQVRDGNLVLAKNGKKIQAYEEKRYAKQQCTYLNNMEFESNYSVYEFNMSGK